MARWGWLLLLVLVLAGWQHQGYLRHCWRHLTGRQATPEALAANVTIYTFDACSSACKDSVDFFRDEDIRHTVVNVDHDAAGLALVQTHGGGLPLIVDGSREYEGYDPEFLEQWYVQRPHVARQLETLGLFARGAPHTAIIFGASWCRYCHLAESYFQSHGIPYRDFDIEASAVANAQERSLFGENPLPGIVYADMLYGGYSEQQLNALRKWNGDEQQ